VSLFTYGIRVVKFNFQIVSTTIVSSYNNTIAREHFFDYDNKLRGAGETFIKVKKYFSTKVPSVFLHCSSMALKRPKVSMT
jgi:hypothetical protein